MGSSGSKTEEINDVKAVQEMDETEMSSKDKLFIIYTVPKVDLCNWSLF